MSQLKISSSWPHFSVPTSVLIDEGTLSKSRMTICELYLKPQSPGSNIIFFRETDGREFIPCVISCNTRSYRVSVGLKPCLRDACLVKTFVEGERERKIEICDPIWKRNGIPSSHQFCRKLGHFVLFFFLPSLSQLLELVFFCWNVFFPFWIRRLQSWS